MVGHRLMIGLLLASVGCASGDDKDTGADELALRRCGDGNGTIFEVQVTRVTLAPADEDGNQWDGTTPTSAWTEDLMEWSDLSQTISTHGGFERGAYENVETLNEYFSTTLFESTAAPDPVVAVYASENGGKTWSIAQTWDQLEGNTHQLGDIYLGRWTLDGKNRIDLRLSDADAPDETRVGDLGVTGVLAQSISDCGTVSLIMSEAEMRKQGSRIHAIEIEIVSID